MYTTPICIMYTYYHSAIKNISVKKTMNICRNGQSLEYNNDKNGN